MTTYSISSSLFGWSNFSSPLKQIVTTGNAIIKVTKIVLLALAVGGSFSKENNGVMAGSKALVDRATCPVAIGHKGLSQLCLSFDTDFNRDTTPAEELDELQKKINSLNWTEKLSTTPPRPLRSHPIDPVAAEKWINAHQSKETRAVAEKIIKNTRHISQIEFEKHLKIAVEKFNGWLQTQKSTDYVLLVSPKKGDPITKKDYDRNKSNRWVAELALSHLKILPKEVLSLRMGEDLFFQSKQLLDYYAANPTTSFVFFDDATFGCSQSKSVVNALTNLDIYNAYQITSQIFDSVGSPWDIREEIERVWAKKEKKHNIVAIIPFMADPACLNDIWQKSEHPYLVTQRVSISPHSEITSHIKVFTSEKFSRFGDFLSREERTISLCLSTKIPAYFDHKMPDAASSCPKVYESGLVSLGNGIPGYMEPSVLQGVEVRFIDPIVPPYKQAPEEETAPLQ